ncbi:MAG: trigger factor family protein, partial [Saprospiraceae bacterium]|nr:trigger factor family protein [Saprospiraceae bacterium]
MKIDRKDTGNGIGTITVTVETADIKDKYNSSLKDYSNKASIKGFRKGKTPVNFIKKMH